MSNDYFPGIGLFNMLTREGPSPAPSPEPEPEVASNRDPNVVYAEPIGEKAEIIDLKLKIKILEEKVRELTNENFNLKKRIELENNIEKIYENMPSLQSIEETFHNIANNIRR